MLNEQLKPATADRPARATALRLGLTGADSFVLAPPQIDNGDEALYADKSGTYTKGVLQTGIGLVDLAAYDTFKKALASGDPADFAKIQLGGTRTLNGPQGGLAWYLKCLDAAQFAVPPAPTLASEEYAAELVELYWASLLRDVAFADYATNAVAAQAATELNGLGVSYKGPRNAANQVTPATLFRGLFDGENIGPYISQFLLQPTSFGTLPIVQRYTTNTAVDFMLTPQDFLDVQNGKAPAASLTPAAPVFMYNGRGLAAYTHADVLYQAYFIAYLVLNSVNTVNNKPSPVPLNPGIPYAMGQPGAVTQNGFATLGGPDAAATLAAVAGEAIRAVWYQKWWVHLRHRPESGGGIVYLQQSGMGGTIQGHVSNTVLNSQAAAASHAKFNSFFLAQAFPEGSPTHPAYPTGHGAVAGACITALKLFFDGTFKFQAPAAQPMVPNNTGTALGNYVAPAGEPPMDVNGELNKLASNISFGHGIHAGIHWRSDTLTSIQLGEAVALSYLRDQVHTYNEKFSITIKKLDGTPAVISNL